MQPGTGADAAVFEKLQQMAIAFVDAAHLVVFPGFGVGEQQQAAAAAAGRAFEFAQIAVRTGGAAAQLLQQLRFKVGLG